MADETPWRSQSIPSMANYFGCDDYDIFHEQKNAEDNAEGYLAGIEYAKLVQTGIITEFKNRSRAYREAVAQAIRETL